MAEILSVFLQCLGTFRFELLCAILVSRCYVTPRATGIRQSEGCPEWSVLAICARDNRGSKL